MSNRLAVGAQLPATRISLSDGTAMTVPDDMDAGYRMVLFFRGSW